MNDDEDSSPGYRVDEGGDIGARRGGGDEEPTLVIVPRIPRPTISKGVGLLATGFGELRRSLFEFLAVFDATTSLGAKEMTQPEKLELAGFLGDAKRRINGVLKGLNRAVSPTPTTNGTNGESP